MKRFAMAVMVLAALPFQFPASAIAQYSEQPKDLEPGDTVVYNVTIDNQTEVLEETWTELAARDTIGIAKTATAEVELVMSRPPDFQIRKGYCPGSRQSCSYYPGLDYAVFPLEKGRKWSSSYTVIGQTFKSDITEERRIERMETIRVPAGEFESFRITATGLVKSRNMKGQMQYAREESTTWVTLISGKLIIVKASYENAFGKKFFRELVSSSLK